MRTYTVHVHPGRRGEDRVIFTKDGFAWVAFFVPLIWLLVKRLWLPAAFFFAATVGWTMAGEWLGLGELPVAIITAAIQLVLGFEANDLCRRRLEAQGYELAAIVRASSLFEAERLFFRDHPDAAPVAEDTGPVWPKRPFERPRPKPLAGGEVLGLFPSPGRPASNS